MTTPSSPTQEEREIAAYIRENARGDALMCWIGDAPIWKTLPWALCNPFKFGKAYGRLRALLAVSNDIESGEWRTQHKGGSND